MAAPTASATGQERHFGRDEIIVTKTDLQGRITYANDVFCRVAALDEREAVGQPHNLIRHPDMPGGVFALLWDRIQAGQEIFGYVLNLAADGRHYWVFAHVTPTFGRDGAIVGYHSNRRAASRHAIDVITPVYRDVRAAEHRAGGGSVAAARAGAAALEERLGDLGPAYDRFVWDLARAAAA